MKTIKHPDTPRPRQAVSITSVTPEPPKSPVKEPKEVTKERPRSNSVTAAPPIARKRTSSGVFQVDETEPPPKKLEPSRKRPEVNSKNPIEAKKGKQDKDSEKPKKQGKKVIERFDEVAKTACVSAFKESDSWD